MLLFEIEKNLLSYELLLVSAFLQFFSNPVFDLIR